MGHNGLNEYGTTATVKATKVYIPVTLSLYDDAQLENTIKTNQIMIKWKGFDINEFVEICS